MSTEQVPCDLKTPNFSIVTSEQKPDPDPDKYNIGLGESISNDDSLSVKQPIQISSNPTQPSKSYSLGQRELLNLKKNLIFECLICILLNLDLFQVVTDSQYQNCK
jgi:hypothetical protein